METREKKEKKGIDPHLDLEFMEFQHGEKHIKVIHESWGPPGIATLTAMVLGYALPPLLSVEL